MKLEMRKQDAVLHIRKCSNDRYIVTLVKGQGELMVGEVISYPRDSYRMRTLARGFTPIGILWD